MKKTFDKTEYDHLIATKQYFPAVWRLIDAGRDDSETIARVSDVVEMARKGKCVEALGKIMKQFPRWVNDEVSAAVHTLLNETTTVDLQPDEL